MDPKGLSIRDYTYTLPEDRVARQPLEERDASRLLVWRNGAPADHHFKDLPELLPEKALMVLNDTRVVHARIRFRRPTGAVLECMVLTPGGDRRIEDALQDRSITRWWCMMGNAKRWKGEELVLEHGGCILRARRLDQRDGEHLIEFGWEGPDLFAGRLEHFGKVPLPPYMRREAVGSDQARYNTVFASRSGSVAAPTASLHFSDGVLGRLAGRGIGTAHLTLHVGAGTFLPVKSGTMAGHSMHAEQVRVPVAVIRRLLEQLGRGPIVPVGTTALRTLESLYWHGVKWILGRGGPELDIDQWEPYAHEGNSLPSVRAALEAIVRNQAGEPDAVVIGSTRLLIAPGYRFRLADALVTNFHQPESTLLLLVAAFIGPRWRSVYDHALAHGYRFLSYGDGSLLFPEVPLQRFGVEDGDRQERE